MKKFISRIFFFLAPIALCSYLIDIFISRELSKSNAFAHGEYPTWNAIIEGNLNSAILIYGSSRAWIHIDPEIIEDSLGHSVFNLGMHGHPFTGQLLRHELTLKNNPKPKVIIHSLDATTLCASSLYNKEQFLPYMLWECDFQSRLAKMKGYSFFDDKIPLIRYYGQFKSIKTAIEMAFNAENPKKRIKGYKGNLTKWNDDFDKIKKIKKIKSEYTVNLNPEVLELFEIYLEQCQKDNIEVILVYSPFYIEGQNIIKNHSEILDLYKKLSDKYEVTFFDFSTDEICYDKKYFYNASHMNIIGSRFFTKKLAQIINSRIQ